MCRKVGRWDLSLSFLDLMRFEGVAQGSVRVGGTHVGSEQLYDIRNRNREFW